MSFDASEDADGSARTGELLRRLGEGDWNARRLAVEELRGHSSDASVDHLLRILREQHRDLSRLNGAIQVLVRTPVNVVPQLLELLKHSDAEVRTYAALTLGERGDARGAEGLIAALKDGDANVRMHAVEALGRLRAATAVDELMQIVEARDFELAFPALDALIAIGDERIAVRLLPLLREPLFKVLAADALGWLGDEEVVKPLLDLLVDPDVPADTVMIALQRIHERYERRYGDAASIPNTVRCVAGPSGIQAVLGAGRILSSSGIEGWTRVVSWLPGPQATEALLDLLDRPASGEAIIPALVQRGSAIVPLLLERLNRVTEDGRPAGFEVLTRLGDRRAVPIFLEMLRSEEEGELIRAADSLARFADLRAYEPLRTLLGHPSPRVRHSAVAAINSLGHPDTASDLLGDFQNDSPLVRESSVRIAAYLGLQACVEAVFDCCDDVDERVRRAAVECLPILDDPRVLPRLANALQTDCAAVRAAAAAALGRVDDLKAAGSLLMQALQDADVWVRYFGVRSLLSSGQHERASSELCRLAREDAAIQVRVAAIEALAGCGSTGLATLLELVDATIPDVANAALLALGAQSDAQAKQVILAALHPPDRDRQAQAIRAVASGSGREFIEPLRACLLGTDDRIAAEAALALGRIKQRGSALALIDATSHLARREDCIAALTRLGDHAIPALAYGLQIYELESRRSIVEALTRIGTGRACDVLTAALDDAQPAVRFAALSALAHRRQARGVPLPVNGGEGEH